MGFYVVLGRVWGCPFELGVSPHIFNTLTNLLSKALVKFILKLKFATPTITTLDISHPGMTKEPTDFPLSILSPLHYDPQTVSRGVLLKFKLDEVASVHRIL